METVHPPNPRTPSPRLPLPRAQLGLARHAGVPQSRSGLGPGLCRNDLRRGPLLVDRDSVRHALALGQQVSFVAPLLLLRSPESIEAGVRWFLRDWFSLTKYDVWPTRRKAGWILGICIPSGLAAYVVSFLAESPLARRTAWMVVGPRRTRRFIHIDCDCVCVCVCGCGG